MMEPSTKLTDGPRQRYARVVSTDDFDEDEQDKASWFDCWSKEGGVLKWKKAKCFIFTVMLIYFAVYALNQARRRQCVSDPSFLSSTGITCEAYEDNGWCADGGYGAEWKSSWGKFSAFADKTSGIDASLACCACGGGVSQILIEKFSLDLPGIPGFSSTTESLFRSDVSFDDAVAKFYNLNHMKETFAKHISEKADCEASFILEHEFNALDSLEPKQIKTINITVATLMVAKFYNMNHKKQEFAEEISRKADVDMAYILNYDFSSLEMLEVKQIRAIYDAVADIMGIEDKHRVPHLPAEFVREGSHISEKSSKIMSAELLPEGSMISDVKTNVNSSEPWPPVNPDSRMVNGTSIPLQVVQSARMDARNPWVKVNPDMQRLFFDSKAMKAYMHEKWPEYDKLNDDLQMVEIADIFRLAWVYDNGGFWSDLDVTPLESVDTWLSNYNIDNTKTIDMMLGVELVSSFAWASGFQINSWTFGSKSGNPLLKAALDEVLKQKRGKSGRKEVADGIGPAMMTHAFKKYIKDHGQEICTLQMVDAHTEQACILTVDGYTIALFPYKAMGWHPMHGIEQGPPNKVLARQHFGSSFEQHSAPEPKDIIPSCGTMNLETLDGETILSSDGKYEYRVTIGGKAKQKDLSTQKELSLGIMTKSDGLQAEFTNGSKCSNGDHRNAKLELKFDKSLTYNTIKVKESGVCSYTILLHMQCSGVSEVASIDHSFDSDFGMILEIEGLADEDGIQEMMRQIWDEGLLSSLGEEYVGREWKMLKANLQLVEQYRTQWRQITTILRDALRKKANQPKLL